jgi:hypothetical protein
MEGRARVTDAHEPADGSKEGRHATLHFTHMGAEGKADQKPEKTLRDEIKGNADEQEKGKGQPKKEPLAKAQDRGKDAGESAARAPRG